MSQRTLVPENDQPPPIEWSEPEDIGEYWKDRALTAESLNERLSEALKVLTVDLAEKVSQLKAHAGPAAKPIPDPELIDRAKRMLLTMKGLSLIGGTRSTMTFPAKVSERLVALAMLGHILDEAVRTGAAIGPEEVRVMWQHWVGKTALLEGNIVDG